MFDLRFDAHVAPRFDSQHIDLARRGLQLSIFATPLLHVSIFAIRLESTPIRDSTSARVELHVFDLQFV